MADLKELSERLKGIAAVKPAPCPYQRKVDEVREEDPETADFLAELVFDTTGISATKLSQELKKSGIIVGRGSVSRHRNRDCTCFIGAEEL